MFHLKQAHKQPLCFGQGPGANKLKAGMAGIQGATRVPSGDRVDKNGGEPLSVNAQKIMPIPELWTFNFWLQFPIP